MSSRPAAGGGTARDAVLSLAIGAWAFAVYARTLGYGLVWDDTVLVDYVRGLFGQGGIGAVLAARFNAWGPTGYYRPLVLASLLADASVAPHFPPSFHLTNVLLHALASALVYQLGKAVLPSARAAALAAVLFAVHPAHVESVAFTSGRTDVGAAVFLLLAAWTWLRARRRVSPHVRAEQAVCFLSWLAACLCKEVAFVFPAVFLLGDAVTPRVGRDGEPGWWMRNRPWVLGFAATFALLVALRGWALGPSLGLGGSSPGDGAAAPAFLGVGALVSVWVTYLRLLVVPWPLNAFYTPSAVALSWQSVLAAGGVLGLCVWFARRRDARIGAAALIWVAGFLLPVFGPYSLGDAIAAERFLYVPSIGFCLLLGVALDRALKRLPAVAAWAGMVLIVLVLSGLSASRAAVWRDEIALFSDVIRTSPDAGMGYNNLGVAYSLTGRYGDSLPLYRQALRLNPDDLEASYNLASDCFQLGRYADAAQALRRIVSRRPDHAVARYHLARAYRGLGDARAAAAERAVLERLDPGLAAAYDREDRR